MPCSAVIPLLIRIPIFSKAGSLGFMKNRILSPDSGMRPILARISKGMSEISRILGI